MKIGATLDYLHPCTRIDIGWRACAAKAHAKNNFPIDGMSTIAIGLEATLNHAPLKLIVPAGLFTTQPFDVRHGHIFSALKGRPHDSPGQRPG